MFNSTNTTNFNIALIGLAEQVGSKKAINIFFNVLERKIDYRKADKIIKSFFKEVGLKPGKYENYRFSNEEDMKKLLSAKLEIIVKQKSLK